MKSLKNIVTSLVVVAGLFLVACDDDGSSASPQDEDSLIEAASSSGKELAKNSSSSRNDNPSDGINSSSSVKTNSSSATSSSSAGNATPCKTETEDNCEYGELVDERDGQTYKTVKIGDQWWMAQNLNYAYLQRTKYLDSSSFCYNDSAQYCEKYGRLYVWSAAMDSAGIWSENGKGCGAGITSSCRAAFTSILGLKVRGVCPEDWHLPSAGEWDALITIVGGSSTAGLKLKSSSGWDGWYGLDNQNNLGDRDGNGTDAYGFSALPAGSYREDDLGSSTIFWTSSYSGESKAYYESLFSYSDAMDLSDYYMFSRFSVRCVKDGVKLVPVSSSSVSSSSVALAMPCKTETEDNCEYSELVDERDGQVYKTVKIGDQVWMAENLNIEMDDSFCYRDSAENCKKFGRLYTWAAAMDSVGAWSVNGMGCGYGVNCSPKSPVRGSCPEGWHLPSKEEWEKLFTAVGGESTAGKVLKSTSVWNLMGYRGTDDFGFSAFPAGFKYYGKYSKKGDKAHFWSSTDEGVDVRGAYDVNLFFNYDDAALVHEYKDYAYSVRCLKD